MMTMHVFTFPLDAVMKAQANATEGAIRQHIADHLKHAPARRGGRDNN